MNQTIKSIGLTDRVWNFFASVKLSVVLLLTLALTSIIGTLIPQNKQALQYIQQYGEFWHGIFQRLNFYDMYGSWWFQLLLALLIVNIVVCSIERLNATWKIIFSKKPVYRADRFRKSDHRRSWVTTSNPDNLKSALTGYMEKNFSQCRVETTDKGYLIFGEKGRWTRIGAYVVHLSILLLTLGVLISSLFGYEGTMNLPVGETSNTMLLRHSNTRVQIDFDLRCDDFSMEHYPNGRVKEYRSEIAILENGEVVENRSLIVNDPIRYRGFNIFQSTYGQIPGNTFTLVFTESASGLQTRKKGSIGEVFDLPGGKGTIVIEDYANSFNFRGHNLGPTYLSVLTPASGSPRPLILPLQHPSFDRMRQGDFIISLENVDFKYFTGLQISRDPGIPIVYSSFVIMILGFIITFYMSHRQVCIEALRTRDNETEVSVSGISPNRRPGVNMAVNRVSGKIERIIEQHK
jgi:cytochrome c biogenesis protein